ncbi:S-layer protein [Thermococcus sp.]
MKVKKIAALAVGAAMLGATIGFASAVHVPNQMPTKDFFVKNGQPNVKIVVGSQGAAQDVVAAADIAVALGTLLYNEKEVEVSGPAVFKELPHAVGQLPVYETPGRLANSNLSALEAEAANYWWNGAAYATTIDNYTGTWSEDLGAYEKILNKKADDWMSELDKISYNADASVKISAIKVVAGDNDAPYPTGDEKIYIPAGAFNYTVNYEQWDYELVAPSYTSCCVYHEAEYVPYLVDPGIQPGDSFTLLGQKYHAVCVYGNYTAGLDLATICPTCVAITPKPYALLLASDAIEGQEGWVSVGGTLTVGPNDEYTINVLDINIVGTEKVLLKVVDNTGVRPTKTISIPVGEGYSVWGDYNGDGADDLVIVLHSTFIGVNGNTEARLLVYTDLRPVTAGDYWPNSEWKVSFYGMVYNDTTGKWQVPNIPGGGWNATGIIGLSAADGISGKAVSMISLVNTQEIGPAKSISVPTFDPLYNLTYSASICGPTMCADSADSAYNQYVYSAQAWIDIVKVGHLATYEMKKGDTLYDALGEGYPDYIQLSDLGMVKTYEPSKVTQPITMLDSEVMAEGLDKVGSNLILVGGPVVNSVTAALADKLGVPSDYNGWESEYGTGADSGVIAYKAECGTIGGYGVLLVAGTDREGTMAAAEYLMQYLSKL